MALLKKNNTQLFIGLTIFLVFLVGFSVGLNPFSQYFSLFKTENTNEVLGTSTIKITFVGDIMLDRWIRQKALNQKNYDFILEEVHDYFSSSDLVVGNLEGPVTNYDSISLGSEIGSTQNYIFTFSPASLSVLKKNTIHLVNLGNNHILNFGDKGLQETYQYLTAAEIDYFGNTGTKSQQRYLLKRINGVTLAFVNYNQFTPNSKLATLEDIAQAKKQADLVILYTHWGNEYVQENQVIKNLAHEFIDAGVDLIIGSHPHVIQGIEDYHGKRIYYSLGNFIFDQYFSEAVKTGLIVDVTINPNTHALNFRENQVTMSVDGKTRLSDQ